MPANRSFLFAPGNHARKVEKVFTAGADAVILDLEDAVAASEKIATREVVVNALQNHQQNTQTQHRCRAYVRVNSIDTEFCYGDLHAVVGPWLDGIVLPKVETPAKLLTIDWLLAQLEREANLAIGQIDLMPIIETGLGITHLDAICNAGSRIKRLSFGAGDFHLDMNMEWTAEEHALADARARLVLASRSAEMEPPIDTVVLQIRDQERFLASARRAREFGFQGKLCIHPDQVQPTHEVFTPSTEEIEHAQRIVTAFAEAEAKGSASIQLDGYFIDYPIVYKAQRILQLMETIQVSQQASN